MPLTGYGYVFWRFCGSRHIQVSLAVIKDQTTPQVGPTCHYMYNIQKRSPETTCIEGLYFYGKRKVLVFPDMVLTAGFPVHWDKFTDHRLRSRTFLWAIVSGVADTVGGMYFSSLRNLSLSRLIFLCPGIKARERIHTEQYIMTHVHVYKKWSRRNKTLKALYFSKLL